MRHRTPDPRPSSLRCVNAAGACVFLTLALAAPAEVQAQSVAPIPEAPVDLGEVVVTAGRTPLTVARARATRTPGGASVIATADFEAEGVVINRGGGGSVHSSLWNHPVLSLLAEDMKVGNRRAYRTLLCVHTCLRL